MRFREVATVIFYDNQGRVALQDRTGYKTKKEEYGFFGGGVKKGEPPRDALIREMREELGINLTGFDFIGKFVGSNSRLTVTMHMFASKVKDLSGLKTKEGRGVKIVTPEEAENLPMGGIWDKMAIRKFMKSLKK